MMCLPSGNCTMPLLASTTTDEDATSRMIDDNITTADGDTVTEAILAPFFHCLFLISLRVLQDLVDQGRDSWLL